VRSTLGLVAAAILLTAAPAHTQVVSAGLSIGARVRVYAPAAGLTVPTRAVIDSIGPDTLYLRQIAEPPLLRSLARATVPVATIAQLDVRAGGGARWARARTGALVGLGLYLVAAGVYVEHEHRTCTGPECFGEGMAWLGLAMGVPVVAGTGGVVGYALPDGHWRRIIP
jgi:hypothetical protein